MNKLIIVGRPTADPEVRYSQDGKALARFNFAVNRRFKRDGEPDADFFSCVAFGKTAETIEKLVRKGTKLLIDGECRNNNYTDQNGVKHYGTQVIVNAFEFCESKSKDTSGESGSGQEPSRTDWTMKNFRLAKEEWRMEKTDMTVKILKEVNVELEKYYTIRAIVINARGVKQCMAEVSTSEKPTEQQIGEFLYTTGGRELQIQGNR